VSIFESGVRDDRGAVRARLVSKAADAGNMRRSRDRGGRAPVARPDEQASYGAIGDTLLAISRLIFPITLLVTFAAAALIYGREPARWLGNIDIGGTPIDTGLLALPLSFFIVQLTNRRYGAGYASTQVLGGMAAIIAAAIYASDDLALLRGTPLPSPRLVAAFGAGLLVAQLISILVFDRLRGPQWWQAPFFATLIGGLVLALTAYPAAYFGTGTAWVGPMAAFAGLCIAAALVLLVPYWLLRGVIAPLPGFGGY
jgi:hypothetical protein